MVGGIPEHWEVKRLKYIIRVRSGDGITNEEMNQDGKYEVYGGNGFIGYSDKFNVKSDSIIIGRVGAKCGNVRYLKGEKWISDNALILKSDQDYTYLKYRGWF
jgi:type I restriction enzyme, S subunit